MTEFEDYIAKIPQGPLHEDDMEYCISRLMNGDIAEDQAARFLTALHLRGETADELTGAARSLRSFASTIDAPKGAVDCCGTGGDGLATYNISTAVALVAAACGVPVAKHGNRSASSKSGAADVLEALGVNLNLPLPVLERALRDLNFCFLMAPNHHAAMKHVAAVRKKLTHRTIFNLLGPLANPANAKKQLIGVYDEKWIMPMAQALQSLGAESALVVHGEDGLDEITLTGPTKAALLKDGEITETSFVPADFGLPHIALADIHGGDARANAIALAGVLRGDHNAYRTIVLANAAAVLFLHDGRSFRDGVHAAAESLDSGNVVELFKKYQGLHA